MMQKLFHAALLLTLITNGACAMSPTPKTSAAPMIVYSCEASTKVKSGQLEQVCMGLQASLAERAGIQVSDLVQGELSVAGQGKALYFRLDILKASPTLMIGTLTWADCTTGTCGPETTGEQISVQISDATLNERSYKQFADTLLTVTETPL